MHIDGSWIPILAIVSMPILVIGVPLARAYARRLEQRSDPRLGAEVAARLERIEQAVDAIAIEMERVSEGQRFTTKLLSERGVARDAAPPASASD